MKENTSVLMNSIFARMFLQVSIVNINKRICKLNKLKCIFMMFKRTNEIKVPMHQGNVTKRNSLL